jgi:serine/threonine protein phosphatase PrpC
MQTIKRWLGKKTETEPLPPSQVDTAPLRSLRPGPDQSISKEKSQPAKAKVHLDLPQLIVGCGHSVGLQREHNEDALFSLTTNLVAGETSIPFGLYIIADGMGGHQHGEIASGVAIRSMANYIIQKIYLSYLGLSTSHTEESIQEILQEGINQAHRSILKDAEGGGTTLTAALIMGDKLTITHVGDSRAYILKAETQPETITHDHSLVKRLVELGQITQDEAAMHPQRNVLYRALGQGEPFEPDIATFPLPKDSYLLLCSDGLWGVVPEDTLLDIVTSSPNPQVACQLLTDAANAAGGPDNISIILVHLPD